MINISLSLRITTDLIKWFIWPKLKWSQVIFMFYVIVICYEYQLPTLISYSALAFMIITVIICDITKHCILGHFGLTKTIPNNLSKQYSSNSPYRHLRG